MHALNDVWTSKNFDRESGLFLTPVLTILCRSYFDGRTYGGEFIVLFRFSVIVRHDNCTLSPTYMHGVRQCGKGNSCLVKLLDGLGFEKILSYNNSPLYVMIKCLPQQIPPYNSLVDMSSKHKLCQVVLMSLQTYDHTDKSY